MPLIQMHIIRAVRSPQEIRKLADVVHQCIREHFAAPKGDRYQVITQHDPGELICEDTGLGIQRSNRLVMINVLQQGRSVDQKQALYANLAEKLKEDCGTPREDLIVSISANSREDWSFGFGRAQFLTGEL